MGLRILYHHRTASRDGQAVHIDELIAAFRRIGHEVRVVGPSAAEEMEFGGENRLVASLKRLLPGALYELLELGYSLLTALRLRREYRQFRPDVYYERYNLFSPAGGWLRRHHQVPYLLEVNSPLAEEREKYGNLRLRRLARWSERYAWRNADRVLPVTDVLADHVRAAGVPEERISVTHNGINRARFSDIADSAQLRSRLGLAASVVLGFTGFVRDWHGLDEVIDTLTNDECADVHLLIVGDGPGRAALENRAVAQGVSQRVHFTGLVDRDEVANYIACFDIALQPSVTPYASPLKIFEYMAMRRAIVAPCTPNIEEILEDGVSALLFNPTVPGAQTAAIIALCTDAALRDRLAQGAIMRVDDQKLTWDDNARKITELAQKVSAEFA